MEQREIDEQLSIIPEIQELITYWEYEKAYAKALKIKFEIISFKSFQLIAEHEKGMFELSHEAKVSKVCLMFEKRFPDISAKAASKWAHRVAALCDEGATLEQWSNAFKSKAAELNKLNLTKTPRN